MVQGVLAASLGLALFTAGGGCSPGDDPVGIVLAKPNLALVVTLQVPEREKFTKVHGIIARLKARGATHLILGVAKPGNGASAEVVAQPQTPSKDLSAVVQELLDSGIPKISIEVK